LNHADYKHLYSIRSNKNPERFIAHFREFAQFCKLYD
jgi:hypothetical protein